MLASLLCGSVQLDQVLITTRHGIRTPLHLFPNDNAVWNCNLNHKFNFQYLNNSVKNKPFLNLKFDVKNMILGSCFKGCLADQGFAQHQRIGSIWRQLYPKLYTNNTRATNKSRTRLSLLGQLIDNTSTPIATWDMDTSVIPDYCPADVRYQDVIKLSPQFNNNDLIQIQQKTWWNVFWTVFSDNFRARTAMSTPFPVMLTEGEINNANLMQEKFWCYQYKENENKEELKKYLQMSTGPYITDLINMIEKDTEFHIRSGHDTILAPLASVLIQGWKCAQPDYASFLVIEINQQEVQVRYRHGDQGEGEYYVMNACGQTKCTVKEFVDHMKQYAVTFEERKEMCENAFK
ncbi:Acid_phosphatase [Hexamita inflata]|uniref:Acid phosphatase n=1 Tax=Hexamita inflata TaxID=28002 RepID=A0AA86NHD8_9EUKA|nr:Acid phosphatase [Hexamita inflata]